MKFEDLSGKTFSDFKVIERDFSKKKTSWICECLLCGKKVSVLAYNLKNGNSKNCGCKRNQEIALRSRKDITGNTYNNVFVETRIGSDDGGKSIFQCKCLLCGKSFEALGSNILSEKIVSCGCVAKANRKHGREQTRTEAIEYGTNVGRIKSKKPLKNNKTTGIRGVCYIKSQSVYRAYIGFQGIRYPLKSSSDIEECIKARKEAEAKLHDGFLEWYKSLKNKDEN